MSEDDTIHHIGPTYAGRAKIFRNYFPLGRHHQMILKTSIYVDALFAGSSVNGSVVDSRCFANGNGDYTVSVRSQPIKPFVQFCDSYGEMISYFHGHMKHLWCTVRY